MPTNDDGFLQAIREDPADDAVRLVYADWLEERDDLRSEYLRIECRLAKLPPGDEGAALLARLREIGEVIRPEWLASVSRLPIENCGLSFQFRCPKRWELLQTTADETVRFCGSCRREVFFCATLATAQTHRPGRVRGPRPPPRAAGRRSDHGRPGK
jgi:uncharacterized protein (TIGR02996 family)